MVILVIIFLFALFGKEFFGGKMVLNDQRFNYDDFLWAFVTVFIVRCYPIQSLSLLLCS